VPATISLTPVPTTGIVVAVDVTPGTRVPAAPTSTSAQYQCFEGGFMILHEESQTVYALIEGSEANIALIVPRTAHETMPDPPTITSPDPGMLIPTGPFGKVWNTIVSAGPYGLVFGLATTPVERFDTLITQTSPDSIRVGIPNGGTIDIGSSSLLWTYTDGSDTLTCPVIMD
jgi:hypothetical protein